MRPRYKSNRVYTCQGSTNSKVQLWTPTDRGRFTKHYHGQERYELKKFLETHKTLPWPTLSISSSPSFRPILSSFDIVLKTSQVNRLKSLIVPSLVHTGRSQTSLFVSLPFLPRLPPLFLKPTIAPHIPDRASNPRIRSHLVAIYLYCPC